MVVSTALGGDVEDPVQREAAIEWLAERVDRFVNVLRPAIRRTAETLRTSGRLTAVDRLLAQPGLPKSGMVVMAAGRGRPD